MRDGKGKRKKLSHIKEAATPRESSPVRKKGKETTKGKGANRIMKRNYIIVMTVRSNRLQHFGQPVHSSLIPRPSIDVELEG